MADYGVRLESALAARRVTLRQLANHLGITYQAVKRVTDGKTVEFSASNHAKAAAYLNISPDWLLTGAGDMTPSSSMGQVMSGKARQLGALLDRIKDEDLRLQAYAHCILILNRNPAYSSPFLAPTPEPLDMTQKSPAHTPNVRQK